MFFNKQLDQHSQGDDGNSEVTSDARLQPIVDLRGLKRIFQVNLLGWQGSNFAVQDVRVLKELEYLKTFEKDPKIDVLKNVELRSSVLVWDEGQWKRGQVKSYTESNPCLRIRLIDEAIEKDFPTFEDLYGLAPTTWIQPPPAGILVQLPESYGFLLETSEITEEKVFCRLRTPTPEGLHSASLFIISEQGHLTEISELMDHIAARDLRSEECYVAHVDAAQNKLHVVSVSATEKYVISLMEKLENCAQRRTLRSPKMNQAVLVSKNGMLIRAQLLNIVPNGFLVECVDYGNVAIVDEVFAISDDLLKIPKLAFALNLSTMDANLRVGELITVVTDGPVKLNSF